MATKTIVTCDNCKLEIKSSGRRIYLSAKRFHDEGDLVREALELSLFCGERCALSAVRALLV